MADTMPAEVTHDLDLDVATTIRVARAMADAFGQLAQTMIAATELLTTLANVLEDTVGADDDG